MLPIAHAGHWALWLLYAVPVIVVCVSIVTTVLRERREPAGGVLQDGEDDRAPQQTRGDE